MEENHSIAIIPARGNSKGIPQKNMFPICGNPLLFYTIRAALDSQVFDKVVVSSECNKILLYASDMGVDISKRSEALSSDDVHSVHVILDYIKSYTLSGDTIVCMLLPTAPLRNGSHIREAFSEYTNSNADSLVSVYQDTKHLMNFRRVNELGFLEPIYQGNPNIQRQELDPLYVVNGSIYFSRVKTLSEYQSFHLGKVAPFFMDRGVSIDINSLEDVAEAERCMNI